MQVRLRGVELRRVIHARAQELLARHFAIAYFHQVQRVAANLFRRETRLVVAGASLFEAHHLPIALRAHDDRLQVEKILVVPVRVERLDADHAFAFVDVHLRGEVGVLHAAQTPLRGLHPELAILVPVHPHARPLRFGVAGERDGAAQPVLPMREQRVAFVRVQRNFRARLRLRAHVAVQRGIFVSANAADEFLDATSFGRNGSS